MREQSLPIETILDRCVTTIQTFGLSVESCLEMYPDKQDELRPLLYLATQLNTAGTLKTSMEFRQSAPIRMQNLIASLPTQQPIVPKSPIWNKKYWQSLSKPLKNRKMIFVTLSFLVIMILFLTGGGSAYAAKAALPGENLYPLKTSIENLRLLLSTRQQDAKLHWTYANRRVEEIDALIEKGQVENISISLENYKVQANAELDYLDSDSPLTEKEKKQLAEIILKDVKNHETRLQVYSSQLATTNLRASLTEALVASQNILESASIILGKLPPPKEPILTTPIMGVSSTPKLQDTPLPSPSLTDSPIPTKTLFPTQILEITPPHEWQPDVPERPKSWEELKEIWKIYIEDWQEFLESLEEHFEDFTPPPNGVWPTDFPENFTTPPVLLPTYWGWPTDFPGEFEETPEPWPTFEEWPTEVSDDLAPPIPTFPEDQDRPPSTPDPPPSP